MFKTYININFHRELLEIIKINNLNSIEKHNLIILLYYVLLDKFNRGEIQRQIKEKIYGENNRGK